MKKPGSSPPSKKTPNKGERTISRQILQAEYHGPIPPPNLLKGYDDIHPGLAERIVRMAEAESLHRHAMEQKALEADIDFGRRSFAERRLGQVFGLMIGLAALVCGTAAVLKGHPVTGGFIGTGGVIGLVTAFLYGRKEEAREEARENTRP